jgi:hypothetical protein
MRLASWFLPLLSWVLRPCAGTRCALVWRLALGGWCAGVLALSLPEAGSPVAGEAIGSRRLTAPRSEVCLTLDRAEEPPLTPAVRLGSPPEARSTWGDGEVDDDDPLAIPPLAFRADGPPPPPVGLDLHGSVYAGGWPTDYLVRPQLLTRLSPLLAGGVSVLSA